MTATTAQVVGVSDGSAVSHALAAITTEGIAVQAVRDVKRDSPRGVFVALEGIDGAGKTTATREAGGILRRRGMPVVAFDKKNPPFVSEYVAAHLAALGKVIWGHPPDDPYLELGDEHWIYLQLSWYSALARCAVEPLLETGHVVLVDTWAYKFLAKLYLRPAVDAAGVRSLFARLVQPDLVIHLHLPPQIAAERKTAFAISEAGNMEGPVELSMDSFVAYQSRLAGVLASFAREEGWQTIDTSLLSAEDVADAVASTVETAIWGQGSTPISRQPASVGRLT